jgi:hypothetical protein
MATTRRTMVLTAMAVVLATMLVPASIADASGTKICCFNNWRYSGTCVIQIGQDQQCGSILSAINNPNDVSTYCSGGGAAGSNVRGGWSMLDCGGGSSSGQTSSRDSGRTRPPQTYDDPPPPSTLPDARSPEIVTPDQTYQGQRGVQAQQPTFIKPVQPTTMADSDGPTVITLR